MQWCFSQVKGAVDEDVAEGKAAHLGAPGARLGRSWPGRGAGARSEVRSAGEATPARSLGEAAPGVMSGAQGRGARRCRVSRVDSGFFPLQVAASCVCWSSGSNCRSRGLEKRKLGVTAGWQESGGESPRPGSGRGPLSSHLCDGGILSGLSFFFKNRLGPLGALDCFLRFRSFSVFLSALSPSPAACFKVPAADCTCELCGVEVGWSFP